MRLAADSEDPEEQDEARAHHPHPPHPSTHSTHFYTLLSAADKHAHSVLALKQEETAGGDFCTAEKPTAAHQRARRLTAGNRKQNQRLTGAQSIAE